MQSGEICYAERTGVTTQITEGRLQIHPEAEINGERRLVKRCYCYFS